MKNLKLAATALSLTCAAACATAPSASAQNSPAYTQQQPGYNIPGSSPGSSYYTGTAPGSDYYAAPAGNKPVLPGGMHQFGKGGNGTPGGYPATAPLPAHAGGYTGGGPEVRVVSPNAYKSKTWFPNGAPRQPEEVEHTRTHTASLCAHTVHLRDHGRNGHRWYWRRTGRRLLRQRRHLSLPGGSEESRLRHLGSRAAKAESRSGSAARSARRLYPGDEGQQSAQVLQRLLSTASGVNRLRGQIRRSGPCGPLPR